MRKMFMCVCVTIDAGLHGKHTIVFITSKSCTGMFSKIKFIVICWFFSAEFA